MEQCERKVAETAATLAADLGSKLAAEKTLAEALRGSADEVSSRLRDQASLNAPVSAIDYSSQRCKTGALLRFQF